MYCFTCVCRDGCGNCHNEAEEQEKERSYLSSSLSQTQQACCSPNFQRALISSMTTCILRIHRRWLKFLDDYLSLVVRWFESTTVDDDEDDVDRNINAVRDIIARLLQRYKKTRPDNADEVIITEEESEQAEFLIKCALLDVAATVLVHPARLETVAVAEMHSRGRIHRCILEAESTLSGKLARFKPALVDFLTTGPARVVGSFLPGISEDWEEEGDSGVLKEDQERNMNTLGKAAALVCALLCKTTTNAEVVGVSSIESTPALPPSRILHRLGSAVNALTDAAAHHHSIPLALLPLLAVAEFCRSYSTQLEEGYAPLLTPIIATLVTVMSYNPMEIVRSCAYECLNGVLDVATPATRLIVLQHMLHDNDTIASSSSAGVVVAIQRLRMEVSSSVYKSPFSQETVLQLAVPYLKRGAAPGWQCAEDVVRGADCMAAALNLLRFVLLQHSRVESSSKIETALLLLQVDRLRDFVDHHLKELYVCIKTVFLVVQDDESSSSSEILDIETLLAVQRLEEVLERTLEVAAAIIVV